MKRFAGYVLVSIAAMLAVGQGLAAALHLQLEHDSLAVSCHHDAASHEQPASKRPDDPTHGDCSKCVLAKALQGSGLISSGVAFLPPAGQLAPVYESPDRSVWGRLGVHPGRAPPTV